MKSHVIRPRLTVLSHEQIQHIHDASLKILSCTGVRVDSERARRILAQATGPASVTDERVRLPHELIQQALQTAPSSVDVYDRRGEFAFRLGNGAETRFGIGVTALYYQDPESEQVTPFTRQNMATLARLGDALPGLDVISTPGVVQDVAPERSDLYATLEMTANAVKPLVLLVSDETRFPDVLDLLAHLHGDPSDRAVRLNTRDEASDQSLAARPFIIPYFNPISPLVINRGTVNKMLVAIERGLPFMYSNYGMAGATTPITPAGTLALLNAELLAGLTLSQLIKPGTSIILGCLPAFFDMKGMGSFYDPHSYLINLACAELMAHYGLPHCGTSGSGMGWGADLIAGGHQWANHLSSCIGKVGLAPFVGDNLGSKAFSPAVVVYADGVIAQARRLVQGFSLDDDSLALDEIAEVGPGGSFLTSKLTLKHFRGAYYRSAVWPNLTLEEWEQKGRPRAGQELRSYTRDLLGRLSAPEDHDDLMAHGEAFIRTLAMRD